jgi:hydrogenase/urease accessory protein HupE
MKEYLQAGFSHVIPFGYDHVLFMMVLYMATSNLREALYKCTLFTLAHSLTLLLTGSGWITIDSACVEPVIAFSIFIMAINNMNPVLPWHSASGVIFIFGLFHGLGFAWALRGFGITGSDFPYAVLSFNLGVELAQLLILLCCFFVFQKWLSNYPWYRQKIFIPLNLLIASVALFWSIDRLLA